MVLIYYLIKIENIINLIYNFNKILMAVPIMIHNDYTLSSISELIQKVDGINMFFHIYYNKPNPNFGNFVETLINSDSSVTIVRESVESVEKIGRSIILKTLDDTHKRTIAFTEILPSYKFSIVDYENGTKALVIYDQHYNKNQGHDDKNKDKQENNTQEEIHTEKTDEEDD